MPSAIASIASGPSSTWTPGSSRTFSAGGKSDSAEGSQSLDVLISNRLDRLAKNIGSSNSPTLGDLRYDEYMYSPPEEFGSSELRYSPAEDSDSSLAGGHYDTIERALESLRRMGQDAVRAQANQPPSGAMS